MHRLRLSRGGDLGGADRLHAEDGAGCLTTGGYLRVQRNNVSKQAHVWAAEDALGRELPSGAVVHHVDEDRLNNANSNLVVCPDRAYHALLHIRMRALEACGDVNARKCSFCRKHDATDNMREGTTSYYHVECQKEYDRRRNATS